MNIRVNLSGVYVKFGLNRNLLEDEPDFFFFHNTKRGG
jgi:hypothetical protein